MRYLFFDIECCNGRDICEFGYVITDDKFNVIEKRNITMNPQKRFNLVGRENHKDLYLCYPETVYFESPTFPNYHKEIKTLIEHRDQIIIGHAIENDAKFLRTACERFDLSYINFDFNDSQKMFKEFFNYSKSISLENAGELLEVEKPQYSHKSDDDSLLTMRFVKKMCEYLEVTLSACLGHKFYKIKDGKYTLDLDNCEYLSKALSSGEQYVLGWWMYLYSDSIGTKYGINILKKASYLDDGTLEKIKFIQEFGRRFPFVLDGQKADY